MKGLLFLNDGSSTRLLAEVQVPAATKSDTAHSFFHKLDFGGRGFALQKSYSLRASTEVGESFNIFAEVLEWAYPS